MSATPPLTFSWRAAYHRAATDAPLKALGITGAMTGFFLLYFTIQNHPLLPVTVVPETWLDRLIPFQAWTLAPYASLWLYVSLVPALAPDRRELLRFGLGALALAVIGLAVFLFKPTVVAAPEIDWSLHPGFAFLKQTDATGNACPSLHAAFAVFCALWLARLLPGLGAGRLAQALNLAWAALIVVSTLGTKQHVALDALAGASLGAWVASLNLIALPTPRHGPFTRLPLVAAVLVLKLCAVLLWSSGLGIAPSLALFVGAGFLFLYHLLVPAAGGLVPVRTGFTPSAPAAREVWLTIDDGPDPDDTPRILDLLDRHEARATFFLIGERAARHPALVAEIARRGHEIAHHTHTHPATRFWCAGPARVGRELDAALAAYAAAVPGLRPARFRPPVGIKNAFLAPALAARGLDCIGWTLRSHDTMARSPDQVATRVARRLRPGAIILLHEGPPLRAAVRVAAITAVLELLRARDYRAVMPTLQPGFALGSVSRLRRVSAAPPSCPPP